MNKLTALVGAALFILNSVNAYAASPDVYVVKFRADNCQSCDVMETQLHFAMRMVNSRAVAEIVIDTTSPILWEKSAHTAFDRDIVPQFNKWVGKTGFVAVIDAHTRLTIGCVSAQDSAYNMANFIKSAAGLPSDYQVSNRASRFRCPPAQNIDYGN
ncbi:MAG: hypothetical protein COA69_13130 [Robiginitomaculum sp.]|nr:MAG: hypothetical protein COA69_13130 [Robiginitomaculum sp.]